MPERIYAYYPGCSLESTAKEYDVSTRLVCQELGIELREMRDWTCCGASSVEGENYLLSRALPARNLRLAEEMNLPLIVPCAKCFSRFKLVAHELSDEVARQEVNQVLDKDFANTVAVEHPLKVLGNGSLSIPVKKPLEGLRVACYYGCLLVRPQEVTQFDDEENPQIMDRLLERLGAQAIDWDFKTMCCGGGLPIARRDIVLKLSHRILIQAKQLGVDCVAVACPVCHSNLDLNQGEMRAKYKDKIDMPVLYFTQLLGLALGVPFRKLLLQRHLTDPFPMLKKRGLV